MGRDLRRAFCTILKLGALGASACRPTTAANLTSGLQAEPGVVAYSVTPSDGGAVLDVTASFPPGVGTTFAIEPQTAAFVRDMFLFTPSGGGQRPSRQAEWMLPCESGCSLHYRVDLAEAAKVVDDVGYAARHEGAFLAPPSSWLVRPVDPPGDPLFRLAVSPVEDIQFVTGLLPSPSVRDAYEAHMSDLPDSPYTAFGHLRTTEIAAPPSTLELAISGDPPKIGEAALDAWVADAVRTVRLYFKRFPISRAAVVLLMEPGSRVGYGTTLGNGGGSIVVRVGRDITQATLTEDWVMTHEMFHLGFPNLKYQHRWLEEGMATYLESIARVRAGRADVLDMWRSLLKGMFFSQPLMGEGGLDETPTWGRTYWGGTLFCLLADVAIRERTNNARSIDDAFRAIVEAGGNVAARWTIERALSIGDKATGTTVLTDLHAQMAHTPVETDLADLWARLGIRGEATSTDALTLRLVPDAPLAHVRDAITAPF